MVLAAFFISVQTLLDELLKFQNATQIPEFASYPEMYLLVDEFLRLFDESGLCVALRVLVLIRLKTCEDKFVAFVEVTGDIVFSSVETGVHLGSRLRGNACCVDLKKSFRFPSMTSSCLFKLSFLVMKWFNTLMTTKFANLSCKSSPSGTQRISSVGNHRFCAGCRITISAWRVVVTFVCLRTGC